MSKPKKKPKKPAHRPTVYTLELGKRICAALIQHKTLKKACEEERKKDATFPVRDTIQEWRFDGEHGDFSVMYATARQCMIENRLDEIFEIAHEKPKIKQIVSVAKVGEEDDAEVITTELEKVDQGAVAANRLYVDTLKWAAVKVIPKLYGEKIEHDIGPGIEQLLTELNEAQKKKSA